MLLRDATAADECEAEHETPIRSAIPAAGG